MSVSRLLAACLIPLLALSLHARGQATDEGTLIAPVTLDGEVLLLVRGISALPAKTRAASIQERLVRIAKDPTIAPESGVLVPKGDSLEIRFGDQRVASLFPEDAIIEDVPLDILADATLRRMRTVITDYRAARTSQSLLRSTGILFGITLLAALLIWACITLLGWFNQLVERRAKHHIERLEQASHRIIHRGQMWGWIGTLARGIRLLAVIAIILTWVSTALGLYPWTRPLSASIFRLVLDPLRELGTGFVHSIPDIAFLVVLTVLVRFILRGIKTFFERVSRGWIRLESFDRDWAMPTYRIVRLLIIVFALVVAYPYIPGSDSDAFKGIGIFMGIVLSIGSTSFIANMLAGYSLTYRAAYREGDRVRIGDHIGEVAEIRTLNTRLRSPKNEEINIPNSIVLNSAVINFSAYQRSDGLILHTEVGIGYDTPWRQVEAMLKLAAGRTEGLLDQPEPFVLQRSLGDFTVVYELNVYCREANRMNSYYSALHANIQDVFNEYGVQIMSPNYDRDPEQPKLVRPEDFYAAPAAPPAVTDQPG